MKNAMIAALAVAALAGCAAGHESAGPAPAAQAQVAKTSSADDEVPLTGSRLAKRKSTDRLLKTVGNTDARDSMDSAPDPMKKTGE